MNTLKDLFLNELADMYDAERRVVKALPKMAKASTCNHLKAVLQTHLEETSGHVTSVEQVFESFDARARRNTCEATKGLLEEADEAVVRFKGSPAINAALVSVAQKLEHYEMASYGCLREWAELLQNKKAAALLQDILDEESASNEALTTVARAHCNPQALGTEENSQPAVVPVPRLTRPRRLVRPGAVGRKSVRGVVR